MLSFSPDWTRSPILSESSFSLLLTWGFTWSFVLLKSLTLLLCSLTTNLSSDCHFHACTFHFTRVLHIRWGLTGIIISSVYYSVRFYSRSWFSPPQCVHKNIPSSLLSTSSSMLSSTSSLMLSSTSSSMLSSTSLSMLWSTSLSMLSLWHRRCSRWYCHRCFHREGGGGTGQDKFRFFFIKVLTISDNFEHISFFPKKILSICHLVLP